MPSVFCFQVAPFVASACTAPQPGWRAFGPAFDLCLIIVYLSG
jgi:hypothetical protein